MGSSTGVASVWPGDPGIRHLQMLTSGMPLGSPEKGPSPRCPVVWADLAARGQERGRGEAGNFTVSDFVLLVYTGVSCLSPLLSRSAVLGALS